MKTAIADAFDRAGYTTDADRLAVEAARCAQENSENFTAACDALWAVCLDDAGLLRALLSEYRNRAIGAAIRAAGATREEKPIEHMPTRRTPLSAVVSAAAVAAQSILETHITPYGPLGKNTAAQLERCVAEDRVNAVFRQLVRNKMGVTNLTVGEILSADEVQALWDQAVDITGGKK